MHWTVHIGGGPERVNHAAIAVENYIYSFGGCCIQGFELGDIDVHTLNTSSLRWKPLKYTSESNEAVPFQRFGHTVVSYGDKIYLWGGRNDFRASNVLHCFDTCNFMWSLPRVSGKIPNSSDGHTACVIGDYMYVFGGYEGEAEIFKEGLSRINLLTFMWEEVHTKGEVPASRDFHTASVIGTKMYIFGGRSYDFGIETFDGGSYCNQISYLDTSTMQWVWPETTGTLPRGRRSHSACVYVNQLYILCGYNSAVEQHFNDVWRFNPETDTWNEVFCHGNGPNPRRRQCCCIVLNRLYLFGGTSPIDEANIRSYPAERETPFQNLVDNSDLYVLDLDSSLYRLCLLEIIQSKLDGSCLPECIRSEIENMTTDNTINNQHKLILSDRDMLLQEAML